MIGAIIERSSDRAYPCIKQSARSGVVVLFTGPDKGVVLAGASSYGDASGYFEDWDEHSFVPLDGEIRLSNL